MRRAGLLILLTGLLSLPTNAQRIFHKADKVFNWGGKIGCNSLFSNIGSLSINDVRMENVQQKYKVGYQASLFGRVNIDRFFIEPSVTWQHAESDIFFNIPKEDDTQRDLYNVYSENRLQYKYKTVEIPIMIGYNIVKEDQYALSLSVGPAIRYNYKLDIKSAVERSVSSADDENTPLGLGLSLGVGASIGRLFLDFVYQFGINEVDSEIQKIKTAENEWTLQLKKRTNVLNFSLGFMF
jgi:putative salt-induced outer membrane protein YdiY